MKFINYYNAKAVKKHNKNGYKDIISFIVDNKRQNRSQAFNIGYENFGILLSGFCKWIHDYKISKNIDKIIFLARDGYIVKQAYEILYPEEIATTDYMYVSRRSLCLPSIHSEKSINKILNSLVLPPIFDITILLSSLCISVKDVKEELVKASITEQDMFKRSELTKNKKIINFIKLIKNKIYKSANKQYELFQNYIKQLECNGNIAIVDIGWHNSIQKNLINTIDSQNKVTIHGLYLGVYDNAKIIEKPHSSNGFLYSYGDDIDRQIKTFSFVSLLESMFLSQEGTTISYQQRGKKTIPILAEYEYKNEKDMLNTIKDFQNGGLTFIKDYKKAKRNDVLSADICSANILKFGCNPTNHDLALFEKINFENYQIKNIVNYNHNSIYYLLHPQKMIQDFYQSGWRIIFLKKLFVIPLPYNALFKLICTVFNRG